jgi:hypothetical protein
MADRQLHAELPERSYERLRLLATLKRQSLRTTLVEIIDEIWDADPDVADWVLSLSLRDSKKAPS